MATYYVRSSGGSDGNDGLSFASGWATVQYALDNMSLAGDTALVCADGIHYPTSRIDFDNTTGTQSNPFLLKGASATGDDDGTMATISGASLSTTTDLTTFTSTVNIIISNIRFTSSTSRNVYISSSFNSGTVLFMSCRIDNAATYGVQLGETSTTCIVNFVDTEIDNNTNEGVYGGSQDTNPNSLINCSIHGNGGNGIECSEQYASCRIIGNRIYNNTGSGILNNGNSRNWLVSNNVFFNNSSHGIDITDTDVSQFILYNNIFRSNGGYGVNAIGTSVTQFSFIDYNCSHNNTSGDININSGVLPGSYNILSDPLFTSEIGGSEDFTLQSSSPCINVGFGYNGL